MGIEKISIIATFISAFTFSTAYANEVVLNGNKPMTVTYRMAHKNAGQQTVLGELQSIKLEKSVTVPVALAGYELAGVVPVTVDGHVLPQSANQFAQKESCSMATNKNKTKGSIDLIFENKTGTCKTKGGIFG